MRCFSAKKKKTNLATCVQFAMSTRPQRKYQIGVELTGRRPKLLSYRNLRLVRSSWGGKRGLLVRVLDLSFRDNSSRYPPSLSLGELYTDSIPPRFVNSQVSWQLGFLIRYVCLGYFFSYTRIILKLLVWNLHVRKKHCFFSLPNCTNISIQSLFCIEG